ncbi:SgcJ/EcaC family oxidoreductase [Nocardioides sp. NBC_00368]|uniref:SgcJ/EcaC family oxidoreductase n=1 Tax=Nocardioides sp. NBC_00368 TaxID=2976000 RepID=UPI002E1EECE7
MTNETISVEQELRTVLDQWATAIAEHRPADVAALFTENALFQGFDPTPGFGRDYINAYYAKQPIGLRAEYELLSTREIAPDVVAGYARVLFVRPDGNVTVHLTVIAQRGRSGWALSHYHVSRI